MQIKVAFRHMDPSNSLREYVERKLARVEKVTEKIIDIQVVFAQEKMDTVVELIANLHGHTAKALERSTDPFAAIDLAMDKFDRQIIRIRERARDHKHGPTVSD